MANDLPYFRFTVQAWQNGKISLESYELKGFFMDVCGYYWINDCNLTLTMLKKKFSYHQKLIDELINLEIIKHEKRHDKIEIEFLVRQMCDLSKKRNINKINGSKGGQAKAKMYQNHSYKDKDKDKDNNKDNIKQNFNDRKLKFALSLEPFLKNYNREMLADFCKYWTEPTKSGTKMRYDLEKTWDTSRRLETWSKNNFGNKSDQKQISTGIQSELTLGKSSE